jgi:hypothetical protein
MILPKDYGTLHIAYNSESIFKKPRKYNMTSKKLVEDPSKQTNGRHNLKIFQRPQGVKVMLKTN